MGGGLTTWTEQLNGLTGFENTINAACNGGYSASFVPAVLPDDPDKRCSFEGSIWAKRVATPLAQHGMSKASALFGINDALLDTAVVDYIANLAAIAVQFCPGSSDPCLWVSTPNNIDAPSAIRTRIDEYATAIKADLWADCPGCCFGVDLNADVDCQADPTECTGTVHPDQEKQNELTIDIAAAMNAGCNRAP